MNDLGIWSDIYLRAIKVALVCITFGLGLGFSGVFYFNSFWILLLGIFFVIVGFGFFFRAHKIKKEYILSFTTSPNLKGELK